MLITSPTKIYEFSSENFPAPLPEKSRPKKLFVQYKDEASLDLLSLLPERGLAVVGPRNPSLRAESLIKSELTKLRGQDFVIVSGFARGVDAIAHEIALKIELPTIAVLGCGLHTNYPTQNALLKKNILEKGGLIISEFELEASPEHFHFPLRNRLIAYWSKALWVVEAQRKSGTLNTANWARQYDRDVYATPSFPGEIKNIGAQDLIDAQHAHPFWGIHSLGQSWLKLATLRSTPNEKSSWDAPPLF